jgi:hypothetical protein
MYGNSNHLTSGSAWLRSYAACFASLAEVEAAAFRALGISALMTVWESCRSPCRRSDAALCLGVELRLHLLDGLVPSSFALHPEVLHRRRSDGSARRTRLDWAAEPS